jgi:nicotinamide N-methyltransferase
MSDQHTPLVETLCQLLDRSASARIYVVAGFHTGRSTLAHFFHLAESKGLVPDEDGIEEKEIINNSSRTWKEDRGTEDTVERKKWLVVAKLKWLSVFVRL